MNTFPLPLPHPGPLPGFGFPDRAPSQRSTTTAFDTSLDNRDKVRGLKRCVVCGESGLGAIEHCHIVPRVEDQTWQELKDKGYLPINAKSVLHEPRNGILMCATHHRTFDVYAWYIRFDITARKYIFVNYSGNPSHQKYHGKAINLDADHTHAPFPALFLIHQQRVPGFWPFRPQPTFPAVFEWQDWLLEEGVINSDGNLDSTSPPPPHTGVPEPLSDPDATTPTHSSRPYNTLDLDTIQSIIQFGRQSQSWKTCVIEGTDWSGTAEANAAKYRSIFHTQKFIFVHYSGEPGTYAPYHGKAIALDINHRYTPFPMLFLIHEQRVRSFWLFAQEPSFPTTFAWQDWIIHQQLVDPLGRLNTSSPPILHDSGALAPPILAPVVD